MLKKLAVLSISILMIAVMLVSAGCGSGSDSKATMNPKSVVSLNNEGIIPQKAEFVAWVALQSVLSDKDTQDLYNNATKEPGLPDNLNDIEKTFKDTTGLDLGELDEVIIFGDIESLSDSDEGYMGVVVTGSFQKDKVIASIEETMGQKLKSENYKGYEIYVIGDDEIDANNAYLSFISDAVFVLGSDQSVKDVIDVSKGDASQLNNELWKEYKSLDGSLLNLAVNIPAELVSEIPSNQDESGLGNIDLTPFKQLTLVTAALDKNGKNVDLELIGNFSDNSSADGAKNTIDGFITLAQGLVQMMGSNGDNGDYETSLVKVINSLKSSVDGTRLTLDLEITTEQIGDVVTTIQGMSSSNEN